MGTHTTAVHPPEATSSSAAEQAVRDGHRALDFIVNNSQLETILMHGSSFWVDPRYAERARANDPALTFQFTLDSPQIHYDSEAGRVVGFFSWCVFVEAPAGRAPSASGQKEKLLELSAVYLVAYGGIPGQPEAQVKSFVEQVGEMATFPYFRAWVGLTSWNSGAPLPILPVISARRRAPRAAPRPELPPQRRKKLAKAPQRKK